MGENDVTEDIGFGTTCRKICDPNVVTSKYQSNTWIRGQWTRIKPKGQKHFAHNSPEFDRCEGGIWPKLQKECKVANVSHFPGSRVKTFYSERLF